jgi:hypothetical protein
MLWAYLLMALVGVLLVGTAFIPSGWLTPDPMTLVYKPVSTESAGIELPPRVIPPQECQITSRSTFQLLETVHAAYSGTLPAAVRPDGPVEVESAGKSVSILVSGRPWIDSGQVVSVAPGLVPDDATVDAISALLRMRVACQNAGYAARYLALHTDAWVVDSFTSAALPGPNGKPRVPEASWEQLLTSHLYEVEMNPTGDPCRRSPVFGVFPMAGLGPSPFPA